MMKSLLLVLAFSLTTLGPVVAGNFLPLPDELVALDSEKGKAIFMDSSTAPFWKLIQFYGMQQDLGSCSVASCTMVLNSLVIPRPLSPTHGKFPIYTSANFFSPEVTAIKPRDQVSSSGMSLAQLVKVLETFPVKAEAAYASGAGVEAFREQLKKSTEDASHPMLVNYLRKSLKQELGGHISPIAAYSAKEDMALILDVSTYKYPWVWVKTELLHSAMAGVDKGSNLSRGWVVVSARE